MKFNESAKFSIKRKKASEHIIKLAKQNIEALEKEISKINEESPLSREQRDRIRIKVNEIMEILGIDNSKDTFRLYKERELEHLRAVIRTHEDTINKVNKKLSNKKLK